jgi:hypothetical protein
MMPLARLKFYKRLSLSINSFLKDLASVFFTEYSQCEPHICRIPVSHSSITEFIRSDFRLLCANGSVSYFIYVFLSPFSVFGE